MKKQFSSTIVGATFLISLTGIISKGVGFLREILYANYFGLQTEFDIYLVSAALPMIISTMLLYLGQNYFIPAFNSIDVSEKMERKNYFIKFFWFFLLFGILLSAILTLVSVPLINIFLKGFNSERIELAVLIFRLFIFSLPLASMVSIISAYQQANFQYKAPAFSQLVVNITLVILLFIFNKNFGIVIIPIGLLVGTLLQLLYLFLKIDVSFTDLIKPMELNFRKFSIPVSFLTIISIELIGQLYSISDRYFISQIDSGGIAALNYSMNLILLPISIFSLAISTAIFPKLSENFATHSSDKLEKNFNLSIVFNLMVFMPITFILFFYGDEIIKILFERGNFNQANSIMTYRLTKILALSLIFYSSYSVANKLIYSINQVKPLLWLTSIGLLLKVVLNIVLVKDLKQNGLAISTVISYIFFFIGAIYIIQRTINIESKSVFIKEMILLTINGALTFFITKFVFAELLFSTIISVFIGISFFVILFYSNIIYIRHPAIQILKSLTHDFFSKKNNPSK
jgi:putative peptidoglycan lipid II flippase